MVKLGKKRAQLFAQEMSRVVCNSVKIPQMRQFLSVQVSVGCDLSAT